MVRSYSADTERKWGTVLCVGGMLSALSPGEGAGFVSTEMPKWLCGVCISLCKEVGGADWNWQFYM